MKKENSDFKSFESAANQGFAQHQAMQSTLSPFGLCYDVFDEGDSLVVEIPFPGLIRDSLQVVQENQWIRVRGETIPQQANRHIIVDQVPKGVFDETICLPCLVEGTDGSAHFSNGILTIKLKKVVSKTLNKLSVSFK